MADRTRQRDPEAMTADEVAALLGVDRQTPHARHLAEMRATRDSAPSEPIVAPRRKQ